MLEVCPLQSKLQKKKDKLTEVITFEFFELNYLSPSNMCACVLNMCIPGWILVLNFVCRDVSLLLLLLLLLQSRSKTVVFNLFLPRGTLTHLCHYFEAPIVCKINITINQNQNWWNAGHQLAELLCIAVSWSETTCLKRDRGPVPLKHMLIPHAAQLVCWTDRGEEVQLKL